MTLAPTARTPLYSARRCPPTGLHGGALPPVGRKGFQLPGAQDDQVRMLPSSATLPAPSSLCTPLAHARQGAQARRDYL